MSFPQANLKKTAKSMGAALLTAAFMMPAANAAPNTPVELTCHSDPQKIAAVQEKITKDLGMMATTSHFTNVGTNENPSWAMTTLMRNPETKKGYQWGRMADGKVCIAKSYSNVEIYPNIKLDARAFMDAKSAPKANDASNGKDISTMGANVALLVKEKEHQFPMYRATVDDIINLKKEPLKTPTKYVEYLVGNPSTKEGTILAANFNGKMIGEYYGVVGVPAKDGAEVKFGAIYSPVMEQMLGLK